MSHSVVQASSISAPPFPPYNYPPEGGGIPLASPPAEIPDGAVPAGSGAGPNNLSTGQVAGIVVGAILLGVAVVSVGALSLIYGRRRQLSLSSKGSGGKPKPSSKSSKINSGVASGSFIQEIGCPDEWRPPSGHTPGSPAGQLIIRLYSDDEEDDGSNSGNDFTGTSNKAMRGNDATRSGGVVMRVPSVGVLLSDGLDTSVQEGGGSAVPKDGEALTSPAEHFVHQIVNDSSASSQNNTATDQGPGPGQDIDMRTINRHVDLSAEPSGYFVNIWVPQQLMGDDVEQDRVTLSRSRSNLNLDPELISQQRWRQAFSHQ